MYYEAREAFKRKLPASTIQDSGCEVDLLLVAVADQWTYLIQAGTDSAVFEMTKWLVQYLDLLMHAERRRDLLSLIKDEIEKNTAHEDCRIALTRALTGEDRLDIQQLMLEFEEAEQGDVSAVSIGKTSGHEVLLSDQPIIEEPPKEDEDHKVLSRWSQESIPELVLEGTLGDLMLCLSSQHADIRTQTLNALRRCRDILKVSPT